MKNLLILLLLSSLVIACEKTDFYENGFANESQVFFKQQDPQVDFVPGLFIGEPSDQDVGPGDCAFSIYVLCYIVVSPGDPTNVGDTVTVHINDGGDTITRMGVVNSWIDSSNHEIDFF